MTNFVPTATISAVDTPSKHWYTALTTYGRSVTGVRLYGKGGKFSVGQRVAVFEDNNEFGFSEMGTHKSQLLLPDRLMPAASREAPSSIALAYIAYLAGNKKRRYKPATVLEIVDGGRMRIQSSILGTVTLPSIIGTGGFYEGARVLVEIQRQPRILGWWNCLARDSEDEPEWWEEGWWNDPETGLGMSGYAPIFLTTGRIPYSANVDLRIMALIDDSYETVKVARFNHRDPLSNSAFIYTYPTTEAEDWLYSQITMGRNFGMVLERYWIKWHKKTFAIVELEELTFPPHPGFSRSITSDGKYFWNDTANIYISDTIDGAGTPIFSLGYTADQMFPVQEFQYGYLLGEPEA